jgi:hypothetical protein
MKIISVVYELWQETSPIPLLLLFRLISVNGWPEPVTPLKTKQSSSASIKTNPGSSGRCAREFRFVPDDRWCLSSAQPQFFGE